MCSVVPAWIYFYLFLALCSSTKVCSGWEPCYCWWDTRHGSKVTDWCRRDTAMTELRNYVHQGSFFLLHITEGLSQLGPCLPWPF